MTKEERWQIDNKQQIHRCKLIHNNKYTKCKGTRHSNWKADIVRLDFKKSCLSSLCVRGRIQWGCTSKLWAQCLALRGCCLIENSELILQVPLSWKPVSELPMRRPQLAIHTESCPAEHPSNWTLLSNGGYLTTFQEQGVTLLLYQLQIKKGRKIKVQRDPQSRDWSWAFLRPAGVSSLWAVWPPHAAQPPRLPWMMAPAVCPPVSNPPGLQERPLSPEELLLFGLEGQPIS